MQARQSFSHFLERNTDVWYIKCMDIDIFWDDNEQLTAPQKELLTRAATAAKEYAHASDASEVCITFVSADEIRTLNREYRAKDSATDVLSFPVDAGFITGQSRPLGDIVICPEVAQRQSDEYGHSLERELAFLVVHGMLHLLGFDHETPEDDAIMCAAQDEILELLKI